MAEMGHTQPALALAIYAQAMRRDHGERDRLRALVAGISWSMPANPLAQSTSTARAPLRAAVPNAARLPTYAMRSR
jgi:hypothetical protein